MAFNNKINNKPEIGSDEIYSFKILFESAPGLYLILLPDFTIYAVSDEYLKATMTTRESIIGKNLFEVFPDNPDDISADGTANLRSSLNTVLKTKEAHRMSAQKYDIRKPDGVFEVRYWSPLNKPVLNDKKEVVFLIHSVEDITLRINHEKEIAERIKDVSDYKFALDEAGIVAFTDKKGIIKYVNEKFCQISKYSREELIGQDHRIVNSGYHSKEFMRNLWATISSGKVWKGEIKNLAKDGTPYWVDTRIVPFLDDDGKPYQYVAVRLDITKQKELEYQLKSQAEELIVQQEELEEVNTELQAQTKNLLASEEELRVQQEELMSANHQLREKRQLLEEKNSELVATSLELNQKANELELSSKYKSEFLANMSHELRTPLNSILLLSKLLADNNESNLSKEQVEFSTVIYNSGNNLLELINDILDLSKIESGKMDVEIESVKIADIYKNLTDLFNPLAKEKGILFSIYINEAVLPVIQTDRIKIEQVLKNFLSNAFKFTENGSVELIIRKPNELECSKLNIDEDHFISFEVKDSGIGIPEEKHTMVFEAFQQADGSTRRKYGGTGLGLSISREISKILGGEILMQSELGKGSSFVLVLPYEASSLKNDLFSNTIGLHIKDDEGIPNPLIKDANVVSHTPSEILDDRFKLKSNDKTILIVEDDTVFAKTLLKFVNERGYKAVVAVSGANALEFAIKYKPVCILLDIQLPVKSGWTVMRELKNNLLAKHIPVYIMSSLELKAKDSVDLGAYNYISKPLAKQELGKILDKINTLLGQSQKKILLVDNNEVHAAAISSFINDESKTCLSATTANEAYEILKKELIDCVVLDMALPDTNGYEVLEKIKKDESLEKIPVIIYTGKSLSIQEEKRIRQYANAIIIKTVDSFKRLSSEISLLINQRYSPEEIKTGKTPYIKDKVLEGKHILVVDDDVRNIFSLTRLLEYQKIKVSSASDGAEANEILYKDRSIDLVLMDMMMPTKDGYETIKDIRKDSTFEKLPIIAVTAKAMLGDRDKCIEAGANDYLTKPVDGDRLLALLRVWLYK